MTAPVASQRGRCSTGWVATSCRPVSAACCPACPSNTGTAVRDGLFRRFPASGSSWEGRISRRCFRSFRRRSGRAFPPDHGRTALSLQVRRAGPIDANPSGQCVVRRRFSLSTATPFRRGCTSAGRYSQFCCGFSGSVQFIAQRQPPATLRDPSDATRRPAPTPNACRWKYVPAVQACISGHRRGAPRRKPGNTMRRRSCRW